MRRLKKDTKTGLCVEKVDVSTQHHELLKKHPSSDRSSLKHPQIQENDNTPLEHTPVNPSSQLWKESLKIACW